MSLCLTSLHLYEAAIAHCTVIIVARAVKTLLIIGSELSVVMPSLGAFTALNNLGGAVFSCVCFVLITFEADLNFGNLSLFSLAWRYS